MSHKDKNTRQLRVWMRDDTIKQIKVLTAVLGREDWNVVMDDMVRIGIAYFNEVAKLELADWRSTFKLMDLRADLDLRTMRGDLPMPEER